MTIARNGCGGARENLKTMISGLIRSATAILVLTCMAAVSVAHAGPLDKISAFDVTAQTLDKALLQFGAQAHVRISFAWNSVDAKRATEPLKGSYTVRAALRRLLKGTHLAYSAAGNTIAIRPDTPKRSAGENRQSEADPPAPDGQLRTGMSTYSLGEVVVTAQKYRQRAFDVPISLDVVTAHELRRLSITDLSGLQYDVPGLYVEGDSVRNYVVLRGVSNVSGNGALVGEYIDEADVSADGYAGQVGYGTGDVQLYDLQRVEVLKGPQGTLYGDGAMGGVIRYITKKPALNRYEMNTNVSALVTEYGAPSQRIEAMFNAPIVAGTLGLRIAGSFQHEGGWVDMPAANLKNMNYSDVTDLRIEARFEPASTLQATATQIIHREAYGIGAGENSQGNITPVYGVLAPPNGEQSFSLSNLTMAIDLGPAKLLSSSTYLKHTEANNNQSYVLPGEVDLESYFPVSNETVSQELRVHGTAAGRWQWTVGGFYKHYRDDSGGSQYFGRPGPLSTAVHYDLLGSTDLSTSTAVFGDTSIKLLRRLTIGVGVRYYKSRFRASSQGALLNNRLAFAPKSAEEDFTSTDPRFYLQYHISAHANMYASAAKGFRAGEPNLGLFMGFNPESLWSYEVGTKVRLLNGRLRPDADVFYEKYSQYVGGGLVTVYGIPTFGTFNIGDAVIKGVDADLAWSFSPGWKIAVKGEVVDARIASIRAMDTGFTPGDRLPLVPRYTFTGLIERGFNWSGLPGFARMYYSQTAPVEGFSTPVTQSDTVRFLNLKVGIRWSSKLEIALLAQNLLNDRGYLDPYWNEGAAYRPRPRTFGIEFHIG